MGQGGSGGAGIPGSEATGLGLGPGTPGPGTPGFGPSGGTLYVVATPIGNLGDVTLRALEVLRAVPLVAAEDTRLTRRLFARHRLNTRLLSYHARNASAREAELLGHLRGGRDLALVSDAGTPLVSDPGERLVRAWLGEGGRVVPIPGASAVLAALVASGLATPRWAFEGFLPRSGRARRERLEYLAAEERATVVFEAPGRAAGTLRDLALACGEERPAALCRELTKLHEEIWHGSLGQLAARAAAEPPRGEVTLVVAGGPSGSGTPARSPAHARAAGATAALGLANGRAEVARLMGEGMSRSAAARRVAATTGLPRRELFREAGP